MANLLGDILFAIARVVIWRCAGALSFKAAVWLDSKIPGRRMKVVLGMLSGLVAFFAVPIFAALLGF